MTAGVAVAQRIGQPSDATGSDQSSSRAAGRRRWRTSAGQVVATQVAVALLIAGSGHGAPTTIAAGALAMLVLATAWLRLGGRWAFQWADTALRYAARRRTLPTDSAAAFIRAVSAGATVEPADLAGDTAAIITDTQGLTAVLELGDATAVLVEPLPDLPPMGTLVPPAGPDVPPFRVQLLLTAGPAPSLRAGSGTPANSYRQLTEGRLLAHARVLLAVRVLAAPGWSTDDLHGALASAVRKLHRRLAPTPVRPLGEAAALRVLGEMAHLDGLAPAREAWPTLRLGGLTQATFLLRRWPEHGGDGSRRLIHRLLALPATATTVSLLTGSPPASPGPGGLDVVVRLAAPDEAVLTIAARALRAVLAAAGADARRLDGEHVGGLAATLPLGVGVRVPVPGLPASRTHRPDLTGDIATPLPGAGLMLGRSRHGDPVAARLFRPGPTRVLHVGGVRCAQLLTFRAMALGARVVVQTARPQAWEPFVRGAAVPGESIAVVPPGRTVQPPPVGSLQPLLVVVDVGPVGADARPGGSWQATLVVRDDFTPADVDVASRADLLLLQPLRQDEAALAGSALGLGEAAHWLTRMRPDMLAVVNRRAVRWAALSPTAIESQLLGPAQRD